VEDRTETQALNGRGNGHVGRIIIELTDDGRLLLYPLTDSDQETHTLLEAITARLRCGDLLELM
jgi:hypothetical protein